MSAIVIHTTPHPSETTPLLHPPSSPSPSSSSLSTTTTNPDPDPSSSAPTTTKKHLHRVHPLRDTLSTLRFVTICTGIWSANFVFAFQATAIPTLAPGIGSGFGHAELGSYLGSVFSLASAVVIPIYGVLMDVLGRQMAMLTACMFFGAGAIGCASSTSMFALIAWRAVAGLGGGGLLTVSSVIVTDLVPLRDRGLYQGIMMSIFGAGSMLGGPISGWLSDRFSWHWAFWLQLPVIFFCATLTLLFLPPSPIPPTHSTLLSGLATLDLPGTLLLLVSISSLILGLSFHTSYLEPWSAPVVWGLLLLAALAGAGFVVVEMRVERPLVELKMLKSKHRGGVMVSGFLLSVGNQAFAFQLPLYFSVVCGTSTAQAGMLISVCGGLGLAMGSMLAGQHIRRGGAYRLLGLLSLVPAVIGSFVATLWKPDWPWWGYYLTFFPCSIGYSVFLCCQLVALISAVDSASMPRATALLYTIRTIGVTLGVSIGGCIQLGALSHNLKHAFKNIAHKEDLITKILHSKAAIGQLPEQLQPLALSAYASSLRTVWVVCGFISLCTLASACFIQEKNLQSEVKGKGKQTGDVRARGGGSAA